MGIQVDAEKKHSMFEWLRLITPALLAIALFMLGDMNFKMNTLEQRLFQHFTNAEIHISRETICTRAEFEDYRNEREKRWDRLYDNMKEMNIMLRNIYSTIKVK